MEKVGRVNGDRVGLYHGKWKSRVYVSRHSKRVKPASNSVPRSGVRELLLSMVIVIFRRETSNVQCTVGATDGPQDPRRLESRGGVCAALGAESGS